MGLRDVHKTRRLLIEYRQEPILSPQDADMCGMMLYLSDRLKVTLSPLIVGVELYKGYKSLGGRGGGGGRIIRQPRRSSNGVAACEMGLGTCLHITYRCWRYEALSSWLRLRWVVGLQ